ncbi:hypothetical protein FQN57_000966 [Myotisia sp. PD_48]|nr:hypothetical protein FQN57_000966 [Myotisia sp. PD_48]
MESQRVLRPRPRKNFENPSSTAAEATTPISEDLSAGSSASPNPMANGTTSTSPKINISNDDNNNKDAGRLTSASRTRSELNLTSSTLFGIYSPTTYDRDDRDGNSTAAPTPWGTGAQTPSLVKDTFGLEKGAPISINSLSKEQRRQMQKVQQHLERDGWNGQNQEGGNESLRDRMSAAARRKHRASGARGLVLPLIRRCVPLFVFGVVYGSIIMHLHDSPQMTMLLPLHIPERVESINFGLEWWHYLVFWGVVGVAVGNMLPWFDILWDETLGRQGDWKSDASRRRESTGGSGVGNAKSSRSSLADWNPMIRSIGAFVGIAFAIRKLPWQSTLQVSLTLALVNPVLWYIIDRTKSGFVLSTIIGLTGMLALLEINPGIVPSPQSSAEQSGSPSASSLLGMTTSQGDIVVGTWIASVLFCSCVCFGNIGRKLAS